MLLLSRLIRRIGQINWIMTNIKFIYIFLAAIHLAMFEGFSEDCTWPSDLDFCDDPYQPLDSESCEFNPDKLSYITITQPSSDRISLLPGSDMTIACETEKASADVPGDIFMWLCDYKSNTDDCLCRFSTAFPPSILYPDPYYVAYGQPLDDITQYTNLNYTVKNLTLPGEYIFICMAEIGRSKNYPYGFTNVTIIIQEEYTTSPMSITETKTWIQETYAPLLISIIETKTWANLGELHYVDLGDDLNITCVVDGFPLPKITWWFQNNICSSQSVDLGTLLEENVLLQISELTEDNIGIYTCLAENDQGTVQKYVEIAPKDIINSASEIKSFSRWSFGIVIAIGLNIFNMVLDIC